MGTVRITRPTDRRRSAGIAVGVTLLLVVFIARSRFRQHHQRGQGRRLTPGPCSGPTRALGTSALTRAALVQATTFAELEETGQVTAEDFDAALAEATGARDRLADLQASGLESFSAAALAHYLGSVDATLAALESSWERLGQGLDPFGSGRQLYRTARLAAGGAGRHPRADRRQHGRGRIGQPTSSPSS